MTVAELIEKLKAMPQDAVAVVIDSRKAHFTPVTNLSHHERLVDGPGGLDREVQHPGPFVCVGGNTPFR